MDPHIPIGQQPLGLDALALMRAFLKIAAAADRRKVIQLAASLAHDAGAPPLAPR
jgi:uncharacterized membrane protein